jgi:glycosyltransferase involved in cell wall biosynthesis
MEKHAPNPEEDSSLKVLVLDTLWRESAKEGVPLILGGLRLHQKVLELMNKGALTIGLSSDPPVFKHRITYAVRQGFSKPLRLEFYRHLIRLWINFLRITHAHKPHMIYNPGVGWHNDWLALFAKILGLKVASYFHHYSLPGGATIYPKHPLDLPKIREMYNEMRRVSRFPLFKLLDYLASIQQLKMVDVVFTGTDFGVDQLRKLGRKKPIIVTGIGIDLEEFEGEPPAEDGKVWDALFVGRMAPEKGIYDLLLIWKSVVDEIPEAKLAVVGKRVQPYYDKWVNKLNEMGLQQNVFHLGELERRELIKTYYSSKIFVFPSRIEGAGIVIAEAMAAGLPVVARNLPAYRKLYHEAPALYLLENEKDLSTKVITLLKMSADERHKIGLANKNYAKKRFSWDNVSRKILNTISSIAPYMG